MSGARHKMKKPKSYTAGTPNVEKEAFKKGGAVGKEVDKPEGKKAKARMDKRPRRASGGRVSPWSSAHGS